MEIGHNIARRRKALGLTLSDLSERCGISPGMLSDVENAKKNPTIRTVSQIADALGCTISELVDETVNNCGKQILRQSERHTLVDPEQGDEREEIAPGFRCRGVEIAVYRIPPNGQTSIFAPHPPGLAEFVLVVRGAIEVTVGDERFELQEGDSASYNPHAPHGFRNLTGAVAELVLVIDHNPR